MSDNTILSQEQIEEMLRNAGQVDTPAPAANLEVDAYFSRDEQDALVEMGNICMGTAATTMYTLLGKKVIITTPNLSVHTWETLAAEHPLPLVAVEVHYIEGISGNNLMLLKEYDVALITDLLMGGSGNIDPNNIVLDEISLSAIREVMNQMVGSSATSLASLLHKTINISTPSSKRILLAEDKLTNIFEKGDIVLKIAFKMEIEGLLSSEIMQILPIAFAKEIAKELLNPEDEPLDQGQAAVTAAEENIHVAPKADYLADTSAPPPQPQQAQASPAPSQPVQQPAAQSQQAAPPYPPDAGAAQPYPPQDQAAPPPYPQGYPPYPYSYPPYGYPPAYPPQYAPQYAPQQQAPLMGGNLKDPATVSVKDVEYPVFGGRPGNPESEIDTQNLWRLLDVPMEVTVELGRCTKTIKQVLDLNVGSVVVLDKLAGELVEIMVNGIQVARGEVVVIDDSYGVRITELNAAELSEITKNG